MTALGQIVSDDPTPGDARLSQLANVEVWNVVEGSVMQTITGAAMTNASGEANVTVGSSDGLVTGTAWVRVLHPTYTVEITSVAGTTVGVRVRLRSTGQVAPNVTVQSSILQQRPLEPTRVPNPTAETDLTGWSATAGTLARDTGAGNYNSAPAGFRLDIAGTLGDAVHTLTGHFRKGVTYTLRIRIRANPTYGEANIVLGHAASGDTATTGWADNGGGAFQSVAVTWTPTADRTSGVTVRVNPLVTTCSYYFDDVRVGFQPTGGDTYAGASHFPKAFVSASAGSLIGLAAELFADSEAGTQGQFGFDVRVPVATPYGPMLLKGMTNTSLSSGLSLPAHPGTFAGSLSVASRRVYRFTAQPEEGPGVHYDRDAGSIMWVPITSAGVYVVEFVTANSTPLLSGVAMNVICLAGVNA